MPHLEERIVPLLYDRWLPWTWVEDFLDQLVLHLRTISFEVVIATKDPECLLEVYKGTDFAGTLFGQLGAGMVSLLSWLSWASDVHGEKFLC